MPESCLDSSTGQRFPYWNAPRTGITATLLAFVFGWVTLSLHASRLRGPPASQVGVVIEPAPAGQISSLLLSAHGLTSAQSRVVAMVIRGHSTRQIVRSFVKIESSRIPVGKQIARGPVSGWLDRSCRSSP